MREVRELIERAAGLHERIAEDVPQIKRGMVWCTVCGRSQKVDANTSSALTETKRGALRMADLSPITAALFWSKVNIPENRIDCWEWTATRNSNGYGRFWDSETESWQLVHRLSYESLKGIIPGGLQVRHLCHNRVCCNPSHLDVGTAKENSEDSAKAGRLVRGSRSPVAKLTEEKVIQIRQNAKRLTTRQLAKEFGVSVGTISNVRNGVIWRHV